MRDQLRTLQASQNRFIGIIAAICVAVWIVAAINPIDRQAWLLENVLLIIFAAVLALSKGRLNLSLASYLCLGLFVLLHIIGAHYTYAKMPLGLWAQDHFGFARNHYDRLAHFAFGFFLVFPLRELLLRFSGARSGWVCFLAAAMILGGSGFFEVLEAIAAEGLAQGQGVAWLGGQGDEWDAQNDMLAALLGAVAMMALTALVKRSRKPAQ